MNFLQGPDGCYDVIPRWISIKRYGQKRSIMKTEDNQQSHIVTSSHHHIVNKKYFRCSAEERQ
eukprot:8212015-Ditylum_brightwellii.AAC.1